MSETKTSYRQWGMLSFIKPFFYTGVFFTFAFFAYTGWLPFNTHTIFSADHADAATVTAVANGNWNAGSTWSSGSPPASGDTAQIGGTYNVTVTATTSVAAINFLATSTAGTLTVNTGVTLAVSGAVTAVTSPSASATSTVTGAGTITAASLAVGSNSVTGTSYATYTTNFVTTITNFTISGGISLGSSYKKSGSSYYYNNAVLQIQSGTLTAASITTAGSNSANSQTVTMTTGAHTGYLLLTGSPTIWTLGTGTNTITLNGVGATVEYSGATPTMDVTTYYNLTLSGSGAATGAVTTVQGNLTLSGTASWTTTAALAISGNLTINSGATLTLGSTSTYTLSVTGTTEIGGALALDNTGAKTFTGQVTIDSGGQVSNVSTGAITFKNGLANNSSASVSFNTSAITFSTNSQSISGADALSFGGTATISSGVVLTISNTNGVTFGSTLTISSPTVANGLTLASSTVTNITGALIFTANTTANNQVITMQGNAALYVGGALTMTGVPTSTGSGEIICDSSGTTASVNITGTTGIKSASTAVSGANLVDLSSCGNPTFSSTGLITITGNLVSSTTSFTELKIGSNGILTASAGITLGTAVNALLIAGSGSVINLTGTLSVVGQASVAGIDSTVVLHTTGVASIASAVTWLGSLSVDSGTTTLSSVIITINGTTSVSGVLTNASNAAAKTFVGAFTVNSGGTVSLNVSTGPVTVFDAGIEQDSLNDINLKGTSTLTGNITGIGTGNIIYASTLTIAGSTTTNNNYSGGAVTVTGTLILTGNWVQGSNSTLNLANTTATSGSGTFSASASGNTVNYTAAAQTIKDPNAGTSHTYYNLGLSGSAAKTLTNITTVNGNLTTAGTITTSGDVITSIGGNLNLNGGTFTATSGPLSIGGSLTNGGGVFAPNSGTVTFTSTSSGQTVAGNSASATFNNVIFNGSGGDWTFNTFDMLITGNLTVTAGALYDSTVNITVNGNVVCGTTCGTIDFTGGTFTQDVAANKNFGTNVSADSTNWTFYGLKFSNSNSSSHTITTSSAGTGNITATWGLTVGDSGDIVPTVLDPGNRLWVLSGTGGAASSTFATVEGRQNSQTTTANTTDTVNFDTTPNDGDLLVVAASFKNAPTITWPAGWTQLSIATDTTGAVTQEIRYRIASSDSSSITLTTNNSVKMETRAWRFTAGEYTGTPEVGVVAMGSSTHPQSPTATPSWGLDNNYWISVFSASGSQTVSVYPTNYIIAQGSANAGASSGVTLGYAGRELQDLTDSPSAFTQSATNPWVAQTIVVRGFVPSADVMSFNASSTLCDHSICSDNTSVFKYTGNGATVACNYAGYYDLQLYSSGSSRLTLCHGSGSTLSIYHNLTIGDGTHAGVTGAVNNPTINVGNTLTISSNCTLVSTGGNLTVNGSFIKSGSFNNNAGAVTLNGASLTNSGTLAFYDLTASSTVSAVSAGNFSVEDNFTISTGTFVSTSGTMTVDGDFINNGMFTHNSGTVLFNGGDGSHNITGPTTFNNVIDTDDGSSLIFTHGQIFTFAGTLTVTGATSGITITSDDGANQWLAHFNNPQSLTITHVEISYSGCDVGSSNVTLNSTDIDGGDNGSCWVFFKATIYFNGGGGGGASTPVDNGQGSNDTNTGNGNPSQGGGGSGGSPSGSGSGTTTPSSGGGGEGGGGGSVSP